MTDIQKRAIPAALKGRDILGAARTGSGKTLAFLIPVLENLYRAQCIGQDAGVGALVISPTRELAIQIFEVLRKIGGRGHLFSAALVIGGKSLREEQEAIGRMNIIVCTPGRILQHLSQNSLFSNSIEQLRMLVLDEADRIMDMGFQRDVDAIVEYLPPDRQTLLFSATQTKRVSDLARLSLRDPEYIAVHEGAESATPSSLQQNYTLTPLPEKLDTLWSFLKSAKKSKIIVFVSSGKQVRYIFEAFRKLQPGIPLMHLHGRQKQFARLEVTSRFASSKAACMFATDVAARGLDFPAVDWVVQLDCPEDADTYIHRVGRTARYQRGGRAVLFLDPAEEEGMLTRLSKAKVPIERINVRPSKMKNGNISHVLANLCFKDPSLKYLGQKAFASYVRSLHIMKDKEIFNLGKYGDNVSRLAESMGLPGAPRIKFTKGDAEAAKKQKNAPRRGMTPSSSEDESDDVQASAKDSGHSRSKYDKMFERVNQDVLAPHYSSMLESARQPSAGDADSDDELFSVKKRIIPEDASVLAESDPTGQAQGIAADSNRRRKALKTKAGAAKLAARNVAGGLAGLAGASSNKLVFDDETGEAHAPRIFADEDDENIREPQRESFRAAERGRLAEADVLDRAADKERRRAKREKRKAREREEDGELPRKIQSAAEHEEDESDNELAVEEKPLALLEGLFSDEEDLTSISAGNHRASADNDKSHTGKKKKKHGKQSTKHASGEDLELLEAQAAALLA